MAVNKKERYEFIERMFANIEHIPIDKVIGSYIPLTNRGRHMMGLCPFHKDTKLGSFVVTPDKGIWKCFTCGDQYAGNAVKFVSLYKNISYLDAAFDVAVNSNVISMREYEEYSKKKYDSSYVEKLEKRYSEKADNSPKPKKAAPEIIHNVYWMMKEMSSLSDAHRKALEEERHLPKERIERDYFTCPTNWKLKDNIVRGIKKKFPQITDEILQTVPGFFYDKQRKKVTFTAYNGLCILIRNANDVIQAVQIRLDNVKEGEQRYIWLSSAFAFYRPEEYAGGCGCGSPKDVLWGRGEKNLKNLCITEGRFKSEVISARGNTTISIQGVSAWNGIINTMHDIRKKQEIKAIYIFLDSDILGKHALFVQSGKMCNEIAKTFPDVSIRYAFWKKDIGKGIDDYIHNTNGVGHIDYVDYKKAIQTSDAGFNYMLKKYGITRMQELPQEKAKEFEENLQAIMEKAFIKNQII